MPPKPPKPPLTHFLCLPLVSETSRPLLETSLQHFNKELLALRSDVFGSSSGAGRALRPVSCMHLTLGVMSLRNQERVDGATRLLQEIDLTALLRETEARKYEDGEAKQRGREKGSEERAENQPNEPKAEGDRQSTKEAKSDCHVLAPHADDATLDPSNDRTDGPYNNQPTAQVPMIISLASLGTMRQPSKTTMLYTTPSDPTGRLMPFCESVRDHFTRAGFLLPKNRPLRLHATVLNTIYASGFRDSGQLAPQQGRAFDHDDNHGDDADDDDRKAQEQAKETKRDGRRKKKKPLEIDAAALLERFREFKWAEDVSLEKLAICKMGAEKVVDEEGRVVDERYVEVAARSLVVL